MPQSSVDLMVNILRENARSIGPSLIKKVERDMHGDAIGYEKSFTSFITPILTNDDLPPTKACTVCGKDKAGLCRRCKTTRYCGQQCQKADWKHGHMLVCFARQNNDGADPDSSESVD